jgi:transcription initiation factor TFIIB
MPESIARHDMGLSTIIGRDDKDASGNKLDPAMHIMMNRLSTWDMRSRLHTPKDRSLSQAFLQLDVLKDKLGLSDGIVEKTACREMGAHRTLDDIGTACNVKRKELARDFRILHNRLDLKIPQTDPIKCIAKVANKVKLSEKTKRQAVEIMSNVMREKLSVSICTLLIKY